MRQALMLALRREIFSNCLIYSARRAAKIKA
uniref:Uncharacterized protein n=1 Tax=Caudovirales sp. ctUL28 TaxID=2826778 RepID=A0A8S5MV88_9CAUD|nr:MAG TPA: hypothetical protein [Caudovirales sp. ctUL28]